MGQRRYTLDEIDSMRDAIASQYPNEWTAKVGEVFKKSTTHDEEIERRLRTYMMGGVAPSEVLAQSGKKITRTPWKP